MFRRMFLATLLVAANLLLFVGPAVAAPALWLVQSPTSKVYLFGTVHIISNDVQWHSPELDAALAASQDLYLEIADANDRNAAARAMLKDGWDPHHPLSTLLSKSDLALLDARAREDGLPGATMFEPMRPWLAFLSLTALDARHSKSGAGSTGGVDLVIRKAFSDAGKPIHGFESFESQTHIFSDMPQATQIAILESSLHAKQNQGEGFDRMIASWQSGDQDALASALQFSAMQHTPVYAPLIADRNAAWLKTLATVLSKPGTTFVAVGAAHMIGADGLPAQLQRLGYTVTRVPIADPSPGATTAASQSPSPSPSSSPAASPSATASPIPPATLVPPQGWKRAPAGASGPTFVVESMWTSPQASGIIFTAHLPIDAATIGSLDAFEPFYRQGLIAAAGAKGVAPSRRVKLCGGKQTGLFTAVTLKAVREDVVVAMSDHFYMAQYVHAKNVKDDPAALRALYSLCAP